MLLQLIYINNFSDYICHDIDVSEVLAVSNKELYPSNMTDGNLKRYLLNLLEIKKIGLLYFLNIICFMIFIHLLFFRIKENMRDLYAWSIELLFNSLALVYIVPNALSQAIYLLPNIRTTATQIQQQQNENESITNQKTWYESLVTKPWGD